MPTRTRRFPSIWRGIYAFPSLSTENGKCQSACKREGQEEYIKRQAQHPVHNEKLWFVLGLNLAWKSVR